MQLGDKLRNIREEQDLKQTDVARKTGISNKVLSSYERNICLPTIDNLILLCHCYQISADELLDIHLTKENPNSKFASSKSNTLKLTDEQKRVLFYYNRLDEENRDAIKGLMVSYYREQEKAEKNE